MCSVCHGAKGEGYKADEAPRLAQHALLAAVDDAYLKHAIENGRSGTTMSAWSKAHGGPLSGSDVDALLAYIHSWDDKPQMKLDERPVSGNVARGQQIFTKECVRCHGTQGTGGPKRAHRQRRFPKDASNGFLRLSIKDGRPGTKMPAFGKKLGDTGVEDVLALLGLSGRRGRRRRSGPPRIRPRSRSAPFRSTPRAPSRSASRSIPKPRPRPL